MSTQSSLIIVAALVPIAVSTICAVIINRRRANRAAKVGTSEFFREVDRIKNEIEYFHMVEVTKAEESYGEYNNIK